MRYVTALLWTSLFLACLPAGAFAGAPLWNLSAPAEVTSLALTPDGERVLLGGERLCLLAGNGTPIWKEWSAEMTACSADGHLIAGVRRGEVTLFDGDASVLWRVDLAADAAAVGLASDGTSLVVADQVGEVRFYGPDSALRATVDTRGDPDDDEETEVQSWVQDLALSEKAGTVAVISSRGLFYYTGAGQNIWAREGKLEGGTAVAVSGSGDEIAAASDAGVRLYNRTGSLLWEEKTRRPVTALAIAGDGSRVLVGLQDNTLTCFNRAGEQVWTFTAGGWIRDIAVSEDGSRVLAGSMDRQALLFDGAGGLLKAHLFDGWVEHVALTADGTAGVAASAKEVIGFSTAVTPPPTTTTPPATVTTTAVPTTPPPTATPSPTSSPEGGGGDAAGVLPLLLATLLVGGVVFGLGYWRRRR